MFISAKHILHAHWTNRFISFIMIVLTPQGGAGGGYGGPSSLCPQHSIRFGQSPHPEVAFTNTTNDIVKLNPGS